MGWVRLFFPPPGYFSKTPCGDANVDFETSLFRSLRLHTKNHLKLFLTGDASFSFGQHPTQRMYRQHTCTQEFFFCWALRQRSRWGWSRYFQGISMKHSLMLSIRIFKLYFAAVGFSRSTTWNNFLLGNAVMCFLFGQHVHRSKKNIYECHRVRGVPVQMVPPYTASQIFTCSHTVFFSS